MPADGRVKRLRTFVAIPLADALRQALASRLELVDPPPYPPPLRGGGRRGPSDSLLPIAERGGGREGGPRVRSSPSRSEGARNNELVDPPPYPPPQAGEEGAHLRTVSAPTRSEGEAGRGVASSKIPIAIDRLHLTLQFLGATLPAQLPAIGAALDAVAARTHPFDLTLAGLGAFPDERAPNTLWLGVSSELAPLARLAAQLGEALLPVGFTAPARPYQPHITLLRPKSPALGRKLLAALRRALPGEVGSMRVESLTLYRSETLPEGPRYTELARARLG